MPGSWRPPPPPSSTFRTRSTIPGCWKPAAAANSTSPAITISWVGARQRIAGSNGIDLVGTGDTLLVAATSGTLTLNGSPTAGAVLLGAGSAIIATSAETLDNSTNVITGDGTIGNAGGASAPPNTELTLQNDAGGTIDANSPGNTLTIDTGNTVTNAGLMEATATAILDIQDPVNNSGLLEASGGSELDITGNTISWVGAANGIAGSNGIDLVGTGDTLLVAATSGTLTLKRLAHSRRGLARRRQRHHRHLGRDARQFHQCHHRRRHHR